jgi:bisphosphoglycerate-independent phosphoglycerate mutase (AlkP superfamily)
LELLESGNATATADSLHAVAERIKRRGLVIILSDMFDAPESVVAALKHFRHKKNEVIVMQVLDPLERSFAFGRDAVFKDLETTEQLMTQPWHIQNAYRESMKSFLDTYKRECRENSIDYVLLDTSTPFDVALFQYLHKRQLMG